MATRRISYRERMRRARMLDKEAWVPAGDEAEDPGLRDVYARLPRAPVRLIVLPLGKAINHGGLVRTAESFRLERVDFAREPDNAVDWAGTRGAHVWQPYRFVDAQEAIDDARKDGYTVAGVTLNDRAAALDDAPWSFPLALVLGQELTGLEPMFERQCDFTVAIPLYGLCTSLNVSVATGIVVHGAIKAYAASHPEFQPARASSRRLLSPPGP